jgi:hypothetical protein
MERYDIIFNEIEKQVINELRQQAISQYRVIDLIKTGRLNNLDMIEKYKNKSNIYLNQEMTAYKVINHFANKQVLCCMIIQPTQSGKTGVMFALIKLFIENPLYMINPTNIYIISGLSSTEWKKQTIERFPDIIMTNIFHRNNLDEFKNKLQNDPRNALLIMDEIQIANQKNQTIFKIFDDANLYDINYLLINNIKIVQFSATPDGCYYDIKQWNENNYKIVSGEIDVKYTSAINIYDENRVLQSKPLTIKARKNNNMSIEEESEIINNINEIKNILENHFIEPSYIIIRALTNKIEYNNTINNLKNIFPETSFNYIEYGQEIKQDLNTILLNNKPEKTTFIIIKEKLRVAFTINQRYISILYERLVKNINDSSIIQSLIGRATGYEHNKNIFIFTNIPSILKYNELLKSDFNNKKINWLSISTKKIKGELVGKNTFNSVDNYNKNKRISNLHEYCDVPYYIQISKDEMKDILNVRPFHYDTQKILNIIKRYNLDLYNKISSTQKKSYLTPRKDYKRFILDNIIKADNNIKSNFHNRNECTKVNKDAHNIFFDDQMNRIIVEFFYSSKIEKETTENNI